MTDKQDVSDKIESIRTVARDVDSREGRIKALRDQIKQIVESMPEWVAVDDLTQSLKEARENLRVALMNKANYNNLMEKLGNEKSDLKDDEEVLSACLVDYYAVTREHQIELNESGDAREVIVRGKLGKDGKYQPSLFNASIEVNGVPVDQLSIDG